MEDIEINEDLAKKKGQLEKTQTKLDVKMRKNKRRRSSRQKIEMLIQKSCEKIEELEDLIEWHHRQISNWKKKLSNIPDEENFSSELSKRDKVSEELEKMEVLAWKIKATREKIEENKEPVLKEFYEKEMKKLTREFKSAKGQGF